MKPNPTILKRFSELEQGVNKVNQTRRRSEHRDYLEPRSAYEEWATCVLNILQRVFGKDSVHFENFTKHYADFDGYYDEFEECLGVFHAAKADYEGGYLLNLHSLVSAEIIDDVLGQAEELLAAKYVGPSCVVAGVALETTLKRLCDKNSIDHAKLDKMNADLAKAGVYNIGVQKQVTAWAHWRNDAAHGTWNTFTEQDVSDMIKGVQRFIADYL
jgi:hypothetical protein